MALQEILETLCRIPGVSGDESAVASAILSMIEEHCDAEIDALGNVIARKKGARASSRKILLDAHMDEVGLIINGIADDGSLTFATVGGIDARVLIGRQVLVGEDALPGVIGGKPIHLQDAEERKTAVPADKLYIDIGCASRDEAEKLVQLGDTVTFLPEFAPFGNGAFRGKAIDNRFGCAVLIDLIQSDLPVDCTFVFSVQEETGGLGAAAAAFSQQPDIAIAVEATSAADLPGISEPDCACKLGKGAVVSFMDKGALYPRPLYRRCMELASQKEIPAQLKTAIAGRNDAAAYQRGAAGAQVVAISAPCRYIHAPQCVIRQDDMQAVRDLIGALLENLANEME
ncbi:MAG: M42 family metallopeptidase [Candidatus Merdivicinus sp.]|jgi:putative aminopeptidase FrvX